MLRLARRAQRVLFEPDYLDRAIFMPR